MTMSCRDGKLHNHSADFGAKSADYCASALSIENAGNIGDHGIGKKTQCFSIKRILLFLFCSHISMKQKLFQF